MWGEENDMALALDSALKVRGTWCLPYRHIEVVRGCDASVLVPFVATGDGRAFLTMFLTRYVM